MTANDLGACEWFVWDLRRSGLIDRGPLDTLVADFLRKNPRAEAPALAEHLVGQGTLTPFQADRVLNGKTQGLVLGPYILLDAIGSGSMGQVYRATSKTDGAAYAVKVLPRRSMWNVRLARRQVRSFGAFAHPAVVPFVDVGTAGGLHYLVWPLADGQTLDAIIQERGRLPHQHAALYALQVAQGLAAAHANNLFHGLVKPSNVMVGADSQARILDFGIGSLLVENEGESLVDTMSTANTLTSGLDCASPESIMEPTNRTPAGDQYSLGCVLYFALTGQVPFPDGSAVEKMMAHQTKEPPPVRELAPEVPEGLARVVERLMSKNPDGRYAGCDEAVEALEAFAGDLPSRVGKGSGRIAAAATRRPGAVGLTPRPAGASSFGGSRPAGASGSGRTGTPAPRGASRPAGASSYGGKGTPPPAGSHPGSKSSPGGSRSGVTRTPPPAAPKLPSRATFQLPAVAAPKSKPGVRVEPAEVEAPETPTPSTGTGTAESLAWADEDARPKISPAALVAAAIAVMIGVYLGATVLMK